MATVLKILRRETGKHPAVPVLLLVGVVGLTLGALLIAAGMALVAQLVAGLAIVPVTFAVYLCRLLDDARPEDNGGGGPPGQDDEPDPPQPATPGDGVDWERFEREFRTFADTRVLVS